MLFRLTVYFSRRVFADGPRRARPGPELPPLKQENKEQQQQPQKKKSASAAHALMTARNTHTHVLEEINTLTNADTLPADLTSGGSRRDPSWVQLLLN